MDNLAPDEKSTRVLIYSMNMLVRGEVVTKESTRVAIWPRTQAMPNIIRINKPAILLFGGSPPKPLSSSEMYISNTSMIGFHLAPPTMDALDYDENEKNRIMEPVSFLMGTFVVKGHIRMATSATFITSLEVAYNGWLSIYNAEITNPFLPQMQAMQVPMLLVSASRISFMK